MVHNLKLAFEKISTDYPALKLNRRGGTLTNKKEYFLKVLVAGGGELLKSQLLMLSAIFIRLQNQRSYHFLSNNTSIILQEY